MNDYTKLPHDIADCMSRAGSPLSDDQKLLLAGYLAPVQQQLEQAQARVAQIHEASHELYSWCVEHLTAEQIKAGLSVGHNIGQLLDLERPAVDAFIARKQAEAVEKFGQEIGVFDSGYDDQEYVEIPRREVKAYAQRLRQQADEIEKAGGAK